MIHAIVALALVAQAERIKVSEAASEITWGKATGYVVGPEGLSVEVEGPGALVFEVRAEGNKPTSVSIHLSRAGYEAAVDLDLRARRGPKPKGYGVAGRAALELPAGQHAITLRTQQAVAVRLSMAKRVPRGTVQVTEQAVTPAAQPEAVAEAEQQQASDAAHNARPAAAAASNTVAPTAGDAVATGAAPADAAPADAAPADAAPADAAPADAAPADAAPADAAPADAATPEATQPPAITDPSAAQTLTELAPAEANTASDARAAAAAALGVAAPPLRIAVYDFELKGVDPNIGTVVTDSMLAEVRKLQGVSAIGMVEIRDMLSHEANKQILGCESDESCLAEIAGALGVDNLVSGQLARVDDGAMFVVRRIDQQRAKVLGTVNKRLQAGSGEEFLATIGPAVEELFPERPLREGMERGVPKEMALRLNPPPLPTWSFWSVSGAAVLAAGAGSVFGLLAKEHERDFRRLANRSRTETVAGADLTRSGKLAERNASYANYSFLGAGALAVSAGIVALFVDWYGYGEQP